MALTTNVLATCKEIATSTWADALDGFSITGVVSGLHQRAGTARVAGFAVPVRETSGAFGTYSLKDFAVGRIIESLHAESILMISTEGAQISTFGALASRAAKASGAVGAVIDGACRDVEEIAAMKFWLASRHVTPLSGKKRIKVEAIGEPVSIGGVTVSAGDLVIADATGIVVVPRSAIGDVLEEARRIHALDLQIEGELRSGKTFTAATSAAGHM
jgi:regulator of RNase E activity RraA